MRVSQSVRRWLTGPQSDPSVRVRYWTEVEGRPVEDARVRAQQRAIGRVGWAATLLERQWPDGHWMTPGTTAEELYFPKFVATNWIAIVLAELGMTRADARIREVAQLILDRFGGHGEGLHGSSGDVCWTGIAVRTMIRFGYLDHPAVQQSIDWIVRTQKADGGWHHVPARTGTLDAWEGLAALAEIPEAQRDEGVRRSIEQGAEFFLQRRLMNEGRAPYPPWFRIHFPNHYYYDILVGLKILTRIGYGSDPRMLPAVNWLRQKRARDGTWALDALVPDRDARFTDYTSGRIVFPIMFEPVHEPSRWATVDALSVLNRVAAT